MEKTKQGSRVIRTAGVEAAAATTFGNDDADLVVDNLHRGVVEVAEAGAATVYS